MGVRACFDPQGLGTGRAVADRRDAAVLRVNGALGRFDIDVDCPKGNPAMLRWSVRLTPSTPVRLEAMPRDLVMLDGRYDPLTKPGLVFVEQAGPTAGLVSFSVAAPKPLTGLYFQDLGALSEYCDVSKVEPVDRVAAHWPELGLSLPVGEWPLPARRQVCLSRAHLQVDDALPTNDADIARRLTRALAAVYRQLPRPEVSYFDWPAAARLALRSLKDNSCTQRIKGHTYINAYVGDSEKPPESMVQLALLVPLLEYGKEGKASGALTKALLRNVATFADARVGSIVRWLPGRKFPPGSEGKPDEMDSWYLLHTLLNVGRLVELGHGEFRNLFEVSCAFAIKAARRFKHRWPVFFRLPDLEIVRAETHPGEGGEGDVPGMYIHVMLQAYALTKSEKYLDEAEAAARMLRGLGFRLTYQTNNTAMSAIALLRLGKITRNRLYRDLSAICMANLMARLWMWQGRYGAAKHYDTFMGLAPLQNAPYLAAYEEHEFFAAAVTYLRESRDNIDPDLELLLSEYVKYLLHRSRFYYGSELPADALAEKQKEGAYRRDLMMPLEDVRTGFQKSGQVGQEVYGGAASFILCSRAYIDDPRLPFVLHAQYPILEWDIELSPVRELAVTLAGPRDLGAGILLLPRGRGVRAVTVADATGEEETQCRPRSTHSHRRKYAVPGGGRYIIRWA